MCAAFIRKCGPKHYSFHLFTDEAKQVHSRQKVAGLGLTSTANKSEDAKCHSVSCGDVYRWKTVSRCSRRTLYRSAVWDHFAFRVTYNDGGKRLVDKCLTVYKR